MSEMKADDSSSELGQGSSWLTAQEEQDQQRGSSSPLGSVSLGQFIDLELKEKTNLHWAVSNVMVAMTEFIVYLPTTEISLSQSNLM